jgi:ubiquinone biosynthesis protein COQ9
MMNALCRRGLTTSTVPIRTALLEASIPMVLEHGWSRDALSAGAVSLGYSPAMHGLIDEGEAGLVEYFMHRGNKYMNDQVKLLPLEEMGVTDTVKCAVKFRLLYMAPYINTWPQAMAIGALPPNLPSTMNSLASISNDIWQRVGDKSTDISWFTKRGLLSGVYVATELHMLTDKSKNYEDTWDFLERRLEDISRVGGNFKDVSIFVTNFSLLLLLT